jgi:hypothetical protein
MGSYPLSFQVKTFHKLQTTDGILTHNFRPIQPLNGRNVWFNVAEDNDIKPRSGPLLYLPAEHYSFGKHTQWKSSADYVKHFQSPILSSPLLSATL